MPPEENRSPEELEQLLENALAENSGLQSKNDVLTAANENLRGRLTLAEKGLRLANLDSLPKSVADDARRRVSLGLPEQTAIQKALEQYDHDQKLASKSSKKEARAVGKEVTSEAQDVVKALLDEKADIPKIRGELHQLTVTELTEIVEAINVEGAKISVKPGETKTNIVGKILEAAQALRDKK